VFFGASCFDPRVEERALLADIKDAGFPGIVNFPTSTFLNGITRSKLDAAGVGFVREVSLLRAARRNGLSTLAYVHTLAEAEAMSEIEVDIINVNFGWNIGGKVGVRSNLGLLEAAEYAKLIFQRIRQIHPTVICMVEGGPIVNSDEMYGVCHTAKSDGYIGGSTIDRLPLEYSIEQVTSSFKAVGMLTQRIAELERKLDRFERRHGFVGRSAEIRNVQEFMDRIAARSFWLARFITRGGHAAEGSS
jgi:predicted TIM-barrel enzyme